MALDRKRVDGTRWRSHKSDENRGQTGSLEPTLSSSLLPDVVCALLNCCALVKILSTVVFGYTVQ